MLCVAHLLYPCDVSPEAPAPDADLLPVHVLQGGHQNPKITISVPIYQKIINFKTGY